MKINRNNFSFLVKILTISFQGIFALLLFILVDSCNEPQVLKKTDAVDCLRILNSDLIHLLNNATERPELKALKFVLSQKSAPIPFFDDSLNKSITVKDFSFKNNTGIYSWNTLTNEFKKMADTGIIIIQFPLPNDASHNAELVISDFSEGEINSGTNFPVLMNAVLLIDGEEALAISHIASIEEKLPLSINTSVIGKGYSFSFNFLRKGKITEGNGNINVNFAFVAGFTEEMQSHFKADIHYQGNTYSYDKILFDQKMFDNLILGNMDFGKIDKTGSYTIDKFNKNIKIKVSSIKYKKEIGDIVLCGSPDTSIQSYCIVFSDGSKMALNDQFGAFDKLLNLMEIIRNLR